MANFIGLVYGTLKQKGIDTSKMSTEEAIEKFNQLENKDGTNKNNFKKFEASGVTFDENGIEYIIDYKTFDKAIEERDKFFKKDLSKLEETMGYGDYYASKMSIDRYTEGDYLIINGYLRGEDYIDKNNTSQIDESIKRLDNIINNFELTEPITVFRNIDAKDLDGLNIGDKDSLKGLILKNKGYSSTSLDEAILEGFAKRNQNITKNEQITLEINVPSGKGRAIPIYQWSNYKEEQEVLIKRDAEIKITTVETRNGKTIIKGELL